MRIRLSEGIAITLSSTFLAFGLYNVHSFSGITEGGILGLTLIFQQWFSISPAISGFVLNVFCYLLGWRTLGRRFIFLSFIASAVFSVAYAVFERFEPLWPEIYNYPLVAAVAGAIFVGVGVGVCVRTGGAPGGDDALAMSISHLTRIPVGWVYLICDVAVLTLSATYIPLSRLWYSFVTVIISGQLIGLISRTGKTRGRAETA